MSFYRIKIRRFVTALMMLFVIASIPEGYSPCSVHAQTNKRSTNARRSKSNSNTTSKSKSNSNAKNHSKSTGTVSKRSNQQRQNRRSNSPKTSAEAKRLQEATQKEIQQTKEKIRLNEQQIKTGLSELNVLSSEISTGRIRVGNLQKKVSSLNDEIGNLGNEIKKNEAELQLMREEYLKAVKKMRLSNKNQSTLAFIFASENFNQAMRRIRYMRQFSAWKEKKSADIGNKVALLGRERERLAVVKEEQTSVLEQLSKSQAELEVKHKKQENLVAALRQDGASLQAHLVAKQNEANRLKETISALIAQEQAKAEAERKAREKAAAEKRAAAEKAAADKTLANKDKNKNTRQETKGKENAIRKKDEELKMEPAKRIETHVAGSNFASSRGKLPRPVDGSWRITNAFGRHSMPELPEVVYDNPGIDAEVQIGSAVKSVFDGKVSGVYKVAGYGTVVIVNHGDYYTVYGNLSSANVTVGSSVGTGTQLGIAGHDPDDSRLGSVHFEVWKGREKQNPSSWLR